nr:putative octanoyltransferase [Quercus suber]
MASLCQRASRSLEPWQRHVSGCVQRRAFRSTTATRTDSKDSLTLTHHHIPSIVPYGDVAQLQSELVQKFLTYKANVSNEASNSVAPNPTIITAQFEPVYTCGRREIGTVTPEQQAFLTQETPWGTAQFHEALRGGQTTFHGPGQLVAYPILDLKQYGIRPRCYVNMLEQAVIATLQHYGLKGLRTENPGVWVSEDDKICALGVHLRRNITSHGIGLNVSTELGWFGRIVACGLEGKRTTNLQQEHHHRSRPFGSTITVDDVANVFVRQFAAALRKEAKVSLSTIRIEKADANADGT